MIDLSKPPNLEKIGWFLNGIVKLKIILLLFILSFVLGVLLYFLLDDYISLVVALALSLLIFPVLPIILIFLLNKFRLIERLTDDWYQKK
jgi:hypothetical protein